MLEPGTLFLAFSLSQLAAKGEVKPARAGKVNTSLIATSTGAIVTLGRFSQACTRYGKEDTALIARMTLEDAHMTLEDVDTGSRVTLEDVDTGLTTNVPNRLKYPAQQSRVCAYLTTYHIHTHIIDSTAAAMCCLMLTCRNI